MLYVTYQCSVCRRKKDLPKDDLRALPNQCTITKGCQGKLFSVGETAFPTATQPVFGLVDWYPRGQLQESLPIIPGEQTILLSTSAAGAVTMAVHMSDADHAANTTLNLNISQLRVEDVASTEYFYVLGSAATMVSGQDANAKTMRFDQAAINDGRVFVIVNGVAKFPGIDLTLSVDKITFNSALPAGTAIDVSVYQQATTIDRVLTFTANSTKEPLIAGGSWSNVSWLETYQQYSVGASIPDTMKWWIYTCSSFGDVTTSARIKITGLYNASGSKLLFPATFLLASTPYEAVDRYLNFSVDISKLSADYAMMVVANTVSELAADIGALVEVYPPFQIFRSPAPSSSSLTLPDTFTTSGAIPTDSPLIRLSGKKILGPI
jgi:hypothetical protein